MLVTAVWLLAALVFGTPTPTPTPVSPLPAPAPQITTIPVPVPLPVPVPAPSPKPLAAPRAPRPIPAPIVPSPVPAPLAPPSAPAPAASEITLAGTAYQNCQIISLAHNYKIYWTVKSDASLDIALEAQVYGYIGGGFSDDDGMCGGAPGCSSGTNPPPAGARRFADGWITSYGFGSCASGCLSDLRMADESNGVLENSNDLTGARYYHANGYLTTEFNRKLDTNDAADYPILLDQAMHFIWATSRTRMETSVDIPSHSDTGAALIHFGNPSTCTVVASPGSYTSGSGDFHLTWTVDQTVTPAIITFEMTCTTTGWCSFGINDLPSMSASDCYTGWVSGGTAVVYDTWSPNTNTPVHDTQDDLLLISGDEIAGKTRIQFSRPLNTGDTSQDYAITDAQVYLIYAYATSDGTSATSYAKHSTTGIAQVNFLGNGTSGGSGNVTATGERPSSGCSANSSSSSTSFDLAFDINTTHILCEMSYQGTGWLSFGFSSGTSMRGDCVVGWVDSNGVPTLVDCNMPDKNTPRVDTSQDVTLTFYEEVNGRTTMAFVRLLDTGDSDDYAVAQGDTVNVVWAYHPNDGTAPYSYPTHTDYGHYSVNLGTCATVSGITAGQILLLLCLGLSLIYGIFRFAKMGCKACNNENGVDVEMNTVEQIPAEPVDTPWEEYFDDEGTPYYYNSETAETVWEQPAEFASTVPGTKIRVHSGAEPRPKSPRHRPGNWLSGVFLARAWRQFSVIDMFLMALFLALCVLAGVIEGLWLSGTVPVILGSLAGACSLLLALPATRNSLLLPFFGIPFERAIKFHRFLGRLAILLVLAHFIAELFSSADAAGLLSTAEGNEGGETGETGGDDDRRRYADLILRPVQQNVLLDRRRGVSDQVFQPIIEGSTLFGTLAFACGVVIFFTSLSCIRRKWFTFFYVSHFFFGPFFLLSALHAEELKIYAILAGILYAADVFFRILWALPAKSNVFKMRGDGVVTLRVPKHKMRPLRRYHVCQYVFVMIPRISPIEWHPFTITSGPREKDVEINMKVLGNWTKKVAELTKRKDEIWACVEGPYGNLRFSYRKFPRVLLLSGGIGITPTISVLQTIYQCGNLYKKTQFKTNSIELVQVVWSVQSEDQFEWFRAEFEEYLAKAEQQGPPLDLRVHITRGEAGSEEFMYAGRPKLTDLFDDSDKKPTALLVCGPQPMVREAWKAASHAKRAGHRVHFHAEVFEF